MSYTSFSNETLSRYAWSGNRTVVLTASSALDSSVMSRIVSSLDRAWTYLSNSVGRQPFLWPATTLNGRATFVEVPRTCGAGCGYVGFTGVEILPEYFQLLYDGVRLRDEYDQVLFYEMGRNFWLFTSRLDYAAPDDRGVIGTGFAVYTRFVAMEAAGLRGGPFNGTPFSTFRQTVESLIDTYMLQNSWTWGNTLRVGLGVPNSLGLGGTDLFASMLLRLRRDYGGELFMRRLWRHVSDRPISGSTPGAVDNFFVAASKAAETNLADLFVNRWRWPISAAAQNEVTTWLAVQDALRVNYRSIQGADLRLRPWFGNNLVFLTEQTALESNVMNRIVSTFDSAYQYYRNVTGISPTPLASTTLNGKGTVAQVPVTCGDGCSYLGSTGNELLSPYFRLLFEGVSLRNEWDQVLFFELGRNFWKFGDKLEYVGDDNRGTIATGFAVFNRFTSMEAVGVAGGPFNGTPFPNFRMEVERLVDTYVNQPQFDWSNTLRAGQGVPNNLGLGATDLFASHLFRLRRDFGGEFFLQSLWREVAARPSRTTTEGAVDNLYVAASKAANTNLSPLFSGTWRWPLSASAIAEVQAWWHDRTSRVYYATFNGAPERLFPWKGTNVVLLTQSSRLDGPVLSKIVGAMDGAYDFVRTTMGTQPASGSPGVLDGRRTVAEVSSGCNAICSTLGRSGLELSRSVFSNLYDGLRLRGEFDSAAVYELSRTFWILDLSIRLDYTGADDFWVVPDGVAVFNRIQAMDRMGVPVGPSHGVSFATYRREVETLVDTYLSTPGANWTNTVRMGQGVTNSLGLRGPELLASFLLRLRRDQGGDAFLQRFWSEARLRPTRSSTQGAVDNFFVAACKAAQRNLTNQFVNSWRWPISTSARAEVRNWLQAQPRPQITIFQRQGSHLVIGWQGGGFLQSAGAVTGAWSNVGSVTSPATNPLQPSATFFRVVR